jgi:hypothetical protein
MKSIIESYLRTNPHVAERLKPGAAAGLESILKNTVNQNESYEERQSQVINRRTGLAQDIGELFQTKGRSLLKTLGQGTFIPRYADRRHDVDKKKHAQEVRDVFGKFLQQRPERYVNSDITTALTNHIAENFVVERNWDGSVSFARLFRGVKIASVSGEEIIRRIAPYRDHDLTEIETLRYKAKFRDEAIRLAGFTPEEARDSKKLQALDDTIKKLEAIHYRQSTPHAFRAPTAQVNDLTIDLVNQYRHENDFPVGGGTLRERQLAQAFAEQEIEKAKAWDTGFEEFTRERTPDFYKNAAAQFTGLDYDAQPKTSVVNVSE